MINELSADQPKTGRKIETVRVVSRDQVVSSKALQSQNQAQPIAEGNQSFRIQSNSHMMGPPQF